MDVRANALASSVAATLSSSRSASSQSLGRHEDGSVRARMSPLGYRGGSRGPSPMASSGQRARQASRANQASGGSGATVESSSTIPCRSTTRSSFTSQQPPLQSLAYQEPIQCNPAPMDAPKEPSQILPFLWMGSLDNANDHSFIEQAKITHIVNVSTFKYTAHPQVLPQNYIQIEILDSFGASIQSHLDSTVRFLKAANRVYEDTNGDSGSCLVHCQAGISRSATVTIAYLMNHRHIGWEKAYEYLKQRRYFISPNVNFCGELIEYESHLAQKGVLHMLRRSDGSLYQPSNTSDLVSLGGTSQFSRTHSRKSSYSGGNKNGGGLEPIDQYIQKHANLAPRPKRKRPKVLKLLCMHTKDSSVDGDEYKQSSKTSRIRTGMGSINCLGRVRRPKPSSLNLKSNQSSYNNFNQTEGDDMLSSTPVNERDLPAPISGSGGVGGSSLCGMRKGAQMAYQSVRRKLTLPLVRHQDGSNSNKFPSPAECDVGHPVPYNPPTTVKKPGPFSLNISSSISSRLKTSQQPSTPTGAPAPRKPAAQTPTNISRQINANSPKQSPKLPPRTTMPRPSSDTVKALSESASQLSIEECFTNPVCKDASPKFSTTNPFREMALSKEPQAVATGPSQCSTGDSSLHDSGLVASIGSSKNSFKQNPPRGPIPGQDAAKVPALASDVLTNNIPRELVLPPVKCNSGQSPSASDTFQSSSLPRPNTFSFSSTSGGLSSPSWKASNSYANQKPSFSTGYGASSPGGCTTSTTTTQSNSSSTISSPSSNIKSSTTSSSINFMRKAYEGTKTLAHKASDRATNTLFKLKTSRDYDDSYVDEENVGIIENSEVNLAGSIGEFDLIATRPQAQDDDNATPTQENYPGLSVVAMKNLVEETRYSGGDANLNNNSNNVDGSLAMGYQKLDDEVDTDRSTSCTVNMNASPQLRRVAQPASAINLDL